MNQPITGTGGLTVWVDGFLATTGGIAGRIQFNNASTTNLNNYQGPTTLWVTPVGTAPRPFDTTTVTGTQGSIQFNQNNNIPATSAVTRKSGRYSSRAVLSQSIRSGRNPQVRTTWTCQRQQ